MIRKRVAFQSFGQLQSFLQSFVASSDSDLLSKPPFSRVGQYNYDIPMLIQISDNLKHSAGSQKVWPFLENRFGSFSVLQSPVWSSRDLFVSQKPSRLEQQFKSFEKVLFKFNFFSLSG